MRGSWNQASSNSVAFSTQFSTTDNNVVDFWALDVFRSGLSAFLEHAVS